MTLQIFHISEFGEVVFVLPSLEGIVANLDLAVVFDVIV
jgi:hypothetical protein